MSSSPHQMMISIFLLNCIPSGLLNNIRTYLKIAALADTALKMGLKCSFTVV